MATPKISLLKASVMNHRPIKCQMQILGKYLRNKLDPVNSCPRVRRGDMKINKTRALGMTIHLKARSEGVCVMKVSGWDNWVPKVMLQVVLSTDLFCSGEHHLANHGTISSYNDDLSHDGEIRMLQYAVNITLYK